MTRHTLPTLWLCAASLLVTLCSPAAAPPPALTADVIEATLSTAVAQYQAMLKRLPPVTTAASALYPRTAVKDEVKLVKASDWCSGFFPGALWLLHEATADAGALVAAKTYTQGLWAQKDNKDTHDVGFILGCSFGNGHRLTGNATYARALTDGAQALATRFNDKVGCLQSWPARNGWAFPVIIDNLMNLELLFWAAKQPPPPPPPSPAGKASATSSARLREMAVSHLDKTLANHFRTDGSSFHVVDYDPATGAVTKKQTHQGLNDASSWARGQAWALYGYTVGYRETGDGRYLAQARTVADYLIAHPRMPEDKVPYWDFDAAPAGTGTGTGTGTGNEEVKAKEEGGGDKGGSARELIRTTKAHQRESKDPQLHAIAAAAAAAPGGAASASGKGKGDAGAAVPRDSSAAAVMSAALLELSTLLLAPPATASKAEAAAGDDVAARSRAYRDFALAQLGSLSAPPYRAAASAADGAGFLLLHGTGNFPRHTEVDAPLAYGDYYYLQALLRARAVLKGQGQGQGQGSGQKKTSS